MVKRRPPVRNSKKFPKDIREKVYAKTDGHCAYCGCSLTDKEMMLSHVVPESLEGEDELYNLMPCCRQCNHFRNDYTVEQFRKELSQIPRKLFDDDYTFRLALKYGIVKINKEPIEFYFEKHKGMK